MNDMQEITEMPAEVNFSKSIPNSYVGKLRRTTTINIDSDTTDHLKAASRADVDEALEEA